MKREEAERISNWYADRYNQYGYSPESLDWGKKGREHVRFKALCGIGDLQGKSILDVGCGFGDLYGYLKSQGWTGEYYGIDIVKEFIAEGQQRFPGANLRCGDFETIEFDRRFDYAFASGIFNIKLEYDNWDFVMGTLTKMFALTDRGCVADFMTSWVDWQQPNAFHADPAVLINKIRALTNRFIIKQDYMPYEFAVFLYKNTKKTPNNTFESF